jgi:hypothetical protein
MSHRIGTVNPLPTTLQFGPDFGPPTSPGIWLQVFTPPSAAAPGTRFVILHFTGAALPAANRVEVDLGYDKDVFTSADGSDFYTRPIRLSAGGSVSIRYITNGSASGQITLIEYGRGENMESVNTTNPGYHNKTNPDVFLIDSPYLEPLYETRGTCGSTPNWENVACLPAGDIRATVAQSVCVFVHIEINENTGLPDLSSCSGTLIAPDLVLCAGHCVSDPNDLNPRSGSVCFDFQTNCDGTRPTGYNPTFYKVNKVVRAFQTNPGNGGGLDYSLLQLKTPVVGVPIVAMRSDLPNVGDPVFEIHHPQAITKKISARHSGPPAAISSISSDLGFTYLFANCDLTGGSSGSALFDMSGRIIGIADISGGCNNGFLAITQVLQDIAMLPPPTLRRDVMLVFDRSGSMSLDAGTGRTKIAEARDAASLFVQLIRAGQGDGIGLESFSTNASSPVDFALQPVTAGSKTALIGPVPFSGGAIGGLNPNGLTSIGAGLESAASQFPAMGPGVNRRTILLMTDGLQNTPPMIADATSYLNNTDLSVIGFGTEANLDGVLLDDLAQAHGGVYTRAGTPLSLKKFFALAFGNMFEAGTLLDPEYDLAAGETSKSIPFGVCSDALITVVLGWDRSDVALMVQLIAPNGAIITSASPGAESSTGQTWMFLRVPLPYGGARDGAWQAVVFRPGGGEFPPPAVDVHFFVNVVVSDGPKLVRLERGRKFYTGDTFNPIVLLRNADSTTPRNADIKVTITSPLQGVGNILTAAKLGPPTTQGGDVIPARQSTLLGIEKVSGTASINYADQTIDLFDDGGHGDGAMEPDGIFGNPLPDLLKMEGSYAFRAVATYGELCLATRELHWNIQVDVGIDPSKTSIVATLTGTTSGGKRTGTLQITPQDQYGNNIGPGRANGMTFTGIPGTLVNGPTKDNGDGTYTVPIVWDPGSPGPGVVVGQPGRAPVVIAPPSSTSTHHHHRHFWKWLAWILALVVLLLLLLLFFA